MYVSTTIGLSVDIHQKTVLYGINRSRICRAALEKEIARIEKKSGTYLPRPPRTADRLEGRDNVSR